ncbi:MAG: hypothetical protein HC911_02845, partial [Chloroflexaceae bacterium]|nr:hypothetical protein [Chloroflexaceae bacterium]
MGVIHSRTTRLFLFISAVVLFQVVVIATLLTPLTATPAVDPDADLFVVRIHAPTPPITARLVATGVDLLEMRDGADLFALVTPDEYNRLLSAGWAVRIDAVQTELLTAARIQPFLGGYRTTAEIERDLRALVDQYPTLTRLQDYGDSWEKQQSGGTAGHDLWALHLRSPHPPTQTLTATTPISKPVFFLMAAIHPREIAVTEIAMRFAEYLLAGYGTDAEATWLLDAYDVVVVPLVNPDGYRLAERELFQRKNRNLTRSASCAEPPTSGNQGGVDLNRNFGYRWGSVDTPFTNPCSQTYPGHAAASEPETQAIKAILRTLYPRPSDAPRPADGVAAPDDTTGVIITLHSYSDLILWPWGSSPAPAPNADGLERLGRRMATLNGYTPAQSVYLYPTSGTTDDWAYAELGVPAYTYEIGPMFGPCGGFMPPFECMDNYQREGGNFWGRNLAALLYGLQVAAAPYTMPAGPHLAEDQLTVISDTARLTVTMTLAATDPLTAAELYIGQTHWRGGTPYPLQPTAPNVWQVVLPLAEVQAQCERGATCLSRTAPLTGTAPVRDVPILLLRGQTGRWGCGG